MHGKPVFYSVNASSVINRSAVVLTHWSVRDVAIINKCNFQNSLQRIVAWAVAVKLLPAELHRTFHWFR